MSPRSSHRRRGTLFLLVLSTALIVTILGLSALTASRVQARGSEGTNDFMQARLHASSAIELGRLWIANDSNWRTTRPNGVWVANVPVGSGSFTLSGTDPDGQPLNNDLNQPLILTGVGVQGSARYKLQVTLGVQSKGLTCLGVSLHAGTSATFSSATVFGTGQTLSANTSMSTSGTSNIQPDVEAVNTITGGTYWGKRTQGVAARTMPGTTEVFNYYLTNGTAIDVTSIPTVSGASVIQNTLISPSVNPYGTGQTNAQGIYVINCNGGTLKFLRCRVVGTLVVLNLGTPCRIQGDVLWEPAVANYPALLVQGALQVDSDRTTALSESAAAFNFNPWHTPYQGAWDNDTSDTYPDLLNGLIYATGGITTTTAPEFNGVVVSGTSVTLSGSVKLSYQSAFANNPPPGFEGEKVMVVSPSTWKQMTD